MNLYRSSTWVSTFFSLFVLFSIGSGLFFAPEAHAAKEEYLLFHSLTARPNLLDAQFTPDNQFIVTLSRQGTLDLWSNLTGKRLRVFSDPKHHAISFILHHSRPLLITGGADNAIQIWDINQGTVLKTLRGHMAPVTSLALSLQGDILVSGSKDGTLIVWDLEQMILKAKLPNAHAGNIESIAIHATGDVFASAGVDQYIRVWSLPDGKPQRTLSEHTDIVTHIAFHPQGKFLISSSADQTIMVWDWEQGKRVNQWKAHSKEITTFEIHRNGKSILSSGKDSQIILWSFPEGLKIKTLSNVDAGVNQVHYNSNAKQIVATFSSGKAQTWSLETSTFLANLQGHTRTITSMDFASNGKYLISASLDKTLRIWDVAGKNVARSYDSKNHRVQSVRFSPDNKFFATAGADSVIGIWDTQRGNKVSELRGHQGKVNALAFQPEGHFLVSGGSDQKWRLWNLDSFELLRSKDAHAAQITSVAFNRDGRFFVTGSDDTLLKLWNYEDGKMLATLKGHGKGITDVAFSPTAPVIASASKDNSIILWDITHPESPVLSKRMEGHSFIISRVLFSKDGNTLISISQDKTARLWDVKTGRIIRILTGGAEPLITGSITPDGKMIAVASASNDIKLISYPLDIVKFKNSASSTDLASRPLPPAVPEPTLPQSPNTLGDNVQFTSTGVNSAIIQVDNLMAMEQLNNPLALRVYATTPLIPKSTLHLDLQKKLNTLMRMKNVCVNVEELEQLAFEVLALVPDDLSAYHAALQTAILRRDFKLVFLITELSKGAKFIPEQYDYAKVTDIQKEFDYWGGKIFDQSYSRRGGTLKLTLNDCDGTTESLIMPELLNHMQLPLEFINSSNRIARLVDLRDFKGLSDSEFKNRVFTDIERVYKSERSYPPARIPLDSSISVPAFSTGQLNLDLGRIAVWKNGGSIYFQLRKAGGLWRNYHTHRDSVLSIFLPDGKYYLKVGAAIQKTFMLLPNTTLDVSP